MAITAEKVLEVARTQIGTKATNVKRCKYNTEYYGMEVSGYNFDWCAAFVWWVFKHAGGADLLYGKTANCGTLAINFNAHGRLLKSGFKPGDVVLFHWSATKSTYVPGFYSFDHVGIIEKCNSDGSYTTIEGNTGGTSNGEVKRQIRWPSNICGVGRPAYGGSSNSSSSSSGSTVTVATPNMFYRVKTKNHGWLPEVKNLQDYAGIEQDPITAIAIKVDKGSLWYRVHVTSGKWYSKVTGYNINDINNGYAGDGSTPIDAITIYYKTPDDLRNKGKVCCAKYQVSPMGTTGYYDWQIDDNTTNGMDGYAGSFGKAIDKLKLYLI
jgi:hypothetical protein